MISEETVQKMLSLKMPTMAQAFRELLATPSASEMSWEEKVAMLIDRECTERENRRVDRRMRDARLPVRACIENVRCNAARGIDKALARQLATCQWVRSKQNVIVHGATGVGKSYLAAALVESTCKRGMRALFRRAPRLLEELALARVSGAFVSTLARLAKVDVLVIDDFLLVPMNESEKRDLLEVVEDRYERSSTVFTSQLDPKSWHQSLGDPTMADAICDRVIHNAHVVCLRGPSIRKEKGLTPAEIPESP
jgi:DNA replication protein DnaC